MRRLIAPPVFAGDDAKTRAAGLLNIILLTAIGGAALYAAVLPIVAPGQIMRLLIVGVILVALLGMRGVMRRGHVQIASVAVVVIIWVGVTWGAATFGGVRAPGFDAYIVSVVIAGLLLGGPAGIAVAVLSSLAGFMLLNAELAGLFPSASPPSLIILVAKIVLFAVSAALLLVARRSVTEALERARRSERTLTELNQQLALQADDLQQVNRAYRMLSLCNQAVVRATEQQSLLQEICDIIVQTGGYRAAWFGFVEHQAAKQVRPVAQAGFVVGYVDALNITWADSERGRGPTGTAIRTGQPCISRDLSSDPDYEPWRAMAVQQGYASSIAVPLFEAGQVVGALNVYAACPAAFDAVEVELLKELAGDVAFSLTALRTRGERERAEAALRDSEQRFRTLFETMAQGVVYHDATGQITLANPAAERILGLSLDQMQGRTSLDPRWRAIHEDGSDFPGDTHPAVVALKTGQPVANVSMGVFNPRCQDYTWININVTPQFRPGEAWPHQVYATFEDITDRKRAEEAHRASERRLSQALKAAQAGAWEWNVTTNQAAWSEENYAVLGLSPDHSEPTYAAWLQCVHPADRDQAEREVARAVEQKGDLDIEFRIVWPDGSVHWINDVGKMLLDEAGRPISMYGIQLDITRRRQTEESLRETQERLKFALDGSNDGLWDVQLDSGAVYISPRGCEILGYRPEDLSQSAQVWSHLVHPDDLSATDAALQAYLEGQTPLFQVEQRLRMASGEWKWILTRGKAVAYTPGGSASRMVGTHTDITDRKQAEEAIRQINSELEQRVAERTRELTEANRRLLELDQLKDQFVSNVSHELRTPLANIKLYIGLLHQGKPEKRDEYAQTLKRESTRLENLIEDLLDLARLDLQTAPIERRPIDLHGLLGQLISDRAALAAERGLSLIFQPASQEPVVFAQHAMLTEVASNLIANAMNYTPRGGQITVTVQAQPYADNLWLTFTVQDTGPGISLADRARLFQRFQRGEVGRNSGAPGTGLGLAICKEIVDKLGGRITLDSQPGQGAIFTVWLHPAASIE